MPETLGKIPASIHAKELNATHIGSTIRVMVESGAVIEDELVELHVAAIRLPSAQVVNSDTTLRVLARFRNCAPAGNGLQQFGPIGDCFPIDPQNIVQVAAADRYLEDITLTSTESVVQRVGG